MQGLVSSGPLGMTDTPALKKSTVSTDEKLTPTLDFTKHTEGRKKALSWEASGEELIRQSSLLDPPGFG